MTQTRIFTRPNRGMRTDRPSTVHSKINEKKKSVKKKNLAVGSPEIFQFINDFRFSVLKNLNTRKNPNKSGFIQINDAAALFLKSNFQITNRWATISDEIFVVLGIETTIFKKESHKSPITLLNFQCKLGNQRKLSYFVMENGKKREKNYF
jgi:hypothetical protein